MRIVTIVFIILLLTSPCFPVDAGDEDFKIKNINLDKLTTRLFVSKLSSLLGNDIRGIWMMQRNDDDKVRDESSNSNTGTLSGGLAWTDVYKTNWAYKAILNGTTDYIDLGDSDDFSFVGAGDLDHAFSIVSLVYFDNVNLNQGILTKYNTNDNFYEYYFEKISSGRLNFLIGNPISGSVDISQIYESSGSVSFGWNFVVATYDGRGISLGVANLGMKMYHNGRLVSVLSSDSGYTGQVNTTTNCFIGAHEVSTGAFNFLDGDIAFSALVGTELSQQQITRIYELVRGIYDI